MDMRMKPESTNLGRKSQSSSTQYQYEAYQQAEDLRKQHLRISEPLLLASPATRAPWI